MSYECLDSRIVTPLGDGNYGVKVKNGIGAGIWTAEGVEKLRQEQSTTTPVQNIAEQDTVLFSKSNYTSDDVKEAKNKISYNRHLFSSDILEGDNIHVKKSMEWSGYPAPRRLKGVVNGKEIDLKITYGSYWNHEDKIVGTIDGKTVEISSKTNNEGWGNYGFVYDGAQNIDKDILDVISVEKEDYIERMSDALG